MNVFRFERELGCMGICINVETKNDGALMNLLQG